MSTEQMKEALLKHYPGEKWQTKVKNMSPEQTYAAYHRITNSSTYRKR